MINEKIGMLRWSGISALQLGHFEREKMNGIFNGILYIKTFKKLPKISPITIKNKYVIVTLLGQIQNGILVNR